VFADDAAATLRILRELAENIRVFADDTAATSLIFRVFTENIRVFADDAAATSLIFRVFAEVRTVTTADIRRHPPPCPFRRRTDSMRLACLVFSRDAQKRLHGGCGRLWKSARNVTAKVLAESLARTYVEAR
jgi:hypothetical protein